MGVHHSKRRTDKHRTEGQQTFSQLNENVYDEIPPVHQSGVNEHDYENLLYDYVNSNRNQRPLSYPNVKYSTTLTGDDVNLRHLLHTEVQQNYTDSNRLNSSHTAFTDDMNQYLPNGDRLQHNYTDCNRLNSSHTGFTDDMNRYLPNDRLNGNLPKSVDLRDHSGDLSSRPLSCVNLQNGAELNGINFSDYVINRQNANVSNPIKLSQHPEVTRLQNRQNARLEDMESRIAKIRQSAKDTALRRRIQQIRRITTNSSCSTQTGDSIRRRNAESTSQQNSESHIKSTNHCSMKVTNSQTQPAGVTLARSSTLDENDNDTNSREVIPVRVLTASESCTMRKTRLMDKGRESSEESYVDCSSELSSATVSSAPANFTSLDFFTNQQSPLVYFLLPILIPLIIVAFILRCSRDSNNKRKPRRR